MSWIDKIEKDLVIQTGDGKEYKPHWINARIAVDFNVSEFDFPNIKGTFVDRREMRGKKYNLEIVFQGHDHLDEMKAFLKSSEDKRYWTITHPYYDVLYVQPISIAVNNSEHNVSGLLIDVIETIERTNPQTELIPVDKIDEDIEFLIEDMADNTSVDEVDSATMLSQMESMYTYGSPRIVEDEDGQRFYRVINDVKQNVQNMTSDANEVIRSTQYALNAIPLLEQDINSKIDLLTNNFNTLQKKMQGTPSYLINLPIRLKRTFENFGANILLATCSTLSQPMDGDFKYRKDIETASETLLGMYSSYLLILDSIATGSGGGSSDYQPVSTILLALNSIINYTVSNLFRISMDSKKEFIFSLTDDSDFISITHQLYGLDFKDSNLEELIENNQLGLNALLMIKKGTPIKYYI